VDDMTWHPGKIYEAWEAIYQSLHETMKTFPRESLQFLAFRGASDSVVRYAASNVLTWLDNRDKLPGFGWFSGRPKGHLRCGLR
jgi:hypothetical protein